MKKKTTQFTDETINLSREERSAYEESVKQYRDLKNVTVSAFHDGKIEGKMEEKKRDYFKWA